MFNWSIVLVKIAESETLQRLYAINIRIITSKLRKISIDIGIDISINFRTSIRISIIYTPVKINMYKCV